MKVSIIVPVYNAEKYIKECFHSIINQTYKNLEILFIDDCGTDNSSSILEELIKQNHSRYIKFIKNEKNSGTGISRNNGIMHSTGDYIYFMDDDDSITPECISLLVEAAIEYNNPDIVCPNVHCPTYNYKATNTIKYYSNNVDVRSSYFQHEWYEMPWNKLISRNFIINNKLYFENIYYEDTPWSLHTALTASSLLLLPNYTYKFRLSESQKTASPNVPKIINDQIISFESMKRLCEIYQKNGKDIIYHFSEITTNHLSLIINNGFYKNQDTKYKKNIYKKIRNLIDKRSTFKSIRQNQIPNGIKLLMLHRLMPFSLGYLYTIIFQKLLSFKFK